MIAVPPARLDRLRVVVDVQHLYKLSNPLDRGAEFALQDRVRYYEAQASTVYAQAIVSWLMGRGAHVLTNDPRIGQLTGPYARRNREANRWDATVYLACHVNAGGGMYALTEYATSYAGSTLARTIGAGLVNDLKEWIPAHTELPINPGQRGHVCVGAVSAGIPAVILEPFFGDRLAMQPLLRPTGLRLVGESIAASVARWSLLP